MPSCTRTPVQIPAHQTASNLLAELQKADQIIHVMLNTMTPAQKSKAHAQLSAAGVSGDGMTRYHERHGVIDAAVMEIANVAVHAGAAQLLTAEAEMAAVIQGAIDVADAAASFANDSISPVMEALAKLADVVPSEPFKLANRVVLLQKLSAVGAHLVEDMASSMEAESRNMRAKLNAIQGGAA